MLEKIRKILNLVLDALAGGSFLVMVALVTYQVITRYIFKSPSTWSEELVSYMFAWCSLFGACLVTGERAHMNIPILVDHCSPLVQKILAIVSEVIVLIFALVILVIGGWQMAQLAMGQLTSSLGVPVGVFYFVLPVAGVVMCAYALLNIIHIVRFGVKAEKEAA